MNSQMSGGGEGHAPPPPLSNNPAPSWQGLFAKEPLCWTPTLGPVPRDDPNDPRPTIFKNKMADGNSWKRFGPENFGRLSPPPPPPATQVCATVLKRVPPPPRPAAASAAQSCLGPRRDLPQRLAWARPDPASLATPEGPVTCPWRRRGASTTGPPEVKGPPLERYWSCTARRSHSPVPAAPPAPHIRRAHRNTAAHSSRINARV